ncbi:hypothetical protein AYK25_02470 [Thermoplasmatales archaeon SM1-50]|nr:MAG: hypothetical protein AYK25_02470 [Thermoplasmatales archaeon SM1-50]
MQGEGFEPLELFKGGLKNKAHRRLVEVKSPLGVIFRPIGPQESPIPFLSMLFKKVGSGISF